MSIESIRLKETLLFPLRIHLLKLMLQNGFPPGVLQRLELSAVNYVMCSWILKQKIEVWQFCAGGKEGENACFVRVENT